MVEPAGSLYSDEYNAAIRERIGAKALLVQTRRTCDRQLRGGVLLGHSRLQLTTNDDLGLVQDEDSTRSKLSPLDFACRLDFARKPLAADRSA